MQENKNFKGTAQTVWDRTKSFVASTTSSVVRFVRSLDKMTKIIAGSVLLVIIVGAVIGISLGGNSKKPVDSYNGSNTDNYIDDYNESETTECQHLVIKETITGTIILPDSRLNSFEREVAENAEWYELEYDSHDRIIKETAYDNGHLLGTITYGYNEHGDLAYMTYDADSVYDCSEQYEYEYDSDGNITKKTRYSDSFYDGEYEYTLYEYENNRCIKEMLYSATESSSTFSNDTLEEYYIYSYHNNGALSCKKAYLNPELDTPTPSITEYNEYGDLIVPSSNNGNIKERKYEYDSNGNKTWQYEYSDFSGNWTKDEFSYTYNANGKLTQQVRLHQEYRLINSDTNSWTLVTNFEYDTDGRRVSEVCECTQGSNYFSDYRITYEYAYIDAVE